MRTDHSAVVIEINSLDTQNHGPSFWKINNSLLEDPTYVELIRENVPVWLSEINFCTDYRIVWDWINMLFAGWEVRIVKNCDRGLEKHFQDLGHSFSRYGPTQSR